MIGFVHLRKRLQGELWKKNSPNLRKVKNDILHDFDGFLTVSGPKNSGKQHVIGFVLLRKRLQGEF